MSRFACIRDVVGSTPCLRLTRYASRQLIAKLEGQNPSGSLFDRLASWQSSVALERGIIGPQTKVIVPSTDAFAMSWSWIAAALGLQCSYRTISPSSPSVTKFLTALGATHQKDDLSIFDTPSTVFEVEQETLGEYGIDENDSTWGIARELYQELGNQLKVLVLPATSRMLIQSTYTYFRHHAPHVRLMLAVLNNEYQPYWSLATWQHPNTWATANRKLLGINEVVLVHPDVAVQEAWQLAQTEAVLTDPESAAALALAKHVETTLSERDGNVVCVLCSNGLSHLDQLYTASTASGLTARKRGLRLSDALLAAIELEPGYNIQRI